MVKPQFLMLQLNATFLPCFSHIMLDGSATHLGEKKQLVNGV